MNAAGVLPSGKPVWPTLVATLMRGATLELHPAGYQPHGARLIPVIDGQQGVGHVDRTMEVHCAALRKQKATAGKLVNRFDPGGL